MFSTAEKIIPTPKALESKLLQWRLKGFQIAFTNGCFDLLHIGHVDYLEQCRAACDALVVGINSDESIRRLKGEKRPLFPLTFRTRMLAALSCIDVIFSFDEDTPLQLIELVRPDVLLKGADYAIEQIVGAEYVMSYGGRVETVPLTPGFSTTGLLERLVQNGMS
jgi:rfaE bifunctional protein nucleotidyltransferase chain/domain